MESDYEDLATLIEIAMEEQDESSYAEIQTLYQALASYYEEQKLLTLLSGEYDGKNAILTFHAGAGAPNPRIGCRCCCGCIPVGLSGMASK